MRLLRHFFLTALLLASLAPFARASDPLPERAAGQSNTVTQPHVTAELIPEDTLAYAGKSLAVILHLHMDPNWHTYWINPGDAGLATTIKWTLSPGWSAGPIQWPTPEIHAMGPLTTYGYGGDVYLLTTLTIPTDTSDHVTDVVLSAHASWLVCQEECIPGRADLALPLHVVGAKTTMLEYKAFINDKLFTSARARLPVPNTRWEIKANYQGMGLGHALVINLKDKGVPQPLGHLYFFPEQGNILSVKETNPVAPQDKLANFNLILDRQQNGEEPPTISGILVSDQLLIGDAKAVYLAPFPTNDTSFSVLSSSLMPATSSETQSSAIVAFPSAPSPPLAGGSTMPTASQPLLLTILVFAFLGGLILNLMPCVLPVLSLKVFSLIKHAGENSGTAWRQGLAFTCGVVVSFWILAGLLIALRAAGNHLGWGFQMQSPGFVLALTFLFFLLALNLFGVFELGASLVGLDAKASSHLGGLTSSFANGALATLAATPCTAPFMGSSVGFAAQQPASISLLIFTVLGLGMAAPYLALTTFPGALRLVPKPGAWMEALKQFMGFLLMGTVIFLVYVFGSLVGDEQVPALLGALLVAGFAAWLYGRWTSPLRAPAVRFFAFALSLLVLAGAVAWGAQLALAKPIDSGHAASANGWQPYSPDAVKQALAQNRPVFVDFTAAWCLSCKVNEAVALDIASTKQAFAEKNVALFRGDWTHSDPQITETLRAYNRDGVPLYLLYSPKNPDQPQVLPEVLTPGMVQAALQKL